MFLPGGWGISECNSALGSDRRFAISLGSWTRKIHYLLRENSQLRFNSRRDAIALSVEHLI
jgi:hypothetical protein